MAPDGFAALELYRQDRFGLLLTDFHMPGMDGFDLTRAIREIEGREGKPRLPIIALTADAMPGIEERCLEVGMDGYLRKPIEIPLLDTMLARFLPEALKHRQPFGTAPEPAPPVVAAGDDGVLDLSRLIRAFGAFDEDAAATLSGFVSGLGGKLAAIERAVAAVDLDQVRAEAHALKGAARNIGAGVLGTLCAELQKAATREDEGAVRQVAVMLPDAIDAVRQAALPWAERAAAAR
jgi:CheY-like chemotaxis protein